MAFREVSVVQIKEALRRWLKGDGERPIAEAVGIDRKTAKRYIAAALELGLDREGGEEQLTDELIGQVVERVRPHRPDGHGAAWRTLLGEEARIKAWVGQELTVVKIGILLARRGVVVPHRTLARFAVERCGAGKRSTTVRVDDPPPGVELQVDFGRLGLVVDAERRRLCWALIFTAAYSRHQFVWPTFRQTTEAVIAGFEAAWTYFGGVFPVVVPDNMASIVAKAENTAPRFNDVFLEYAQSRGFVIDAARVATPTDKPRVERAVPYVRNNFFAGRDLHRSPRRGGAGRDVVHRYRRHPDPRHDPVPPHRSVPRRGAPAAVGDAGLGVRCSEMVRAQGAPRLPRRSRQGALLSSSPPSRSAPESKAGLVDGQALFPGRAGEGPPSKSSWSALDGCRRLPGGPGDLRDPRPRPAQALGGRSRRGDRRLCLRTVGQPPALDQDAPGLSPPRSGEEVGPRARRVGLSPRP